MDGDATMMWAPATHERAPAPTRAQERTRTRLALHLLGGFRLVVGGVTAQVAPSVQRLLVWVALRQGPSRRSVIAGELWPGADDERAHASLRSALWRARQVHDELVAVAGEEIRLDPAVAVDVHQMSEAARGAVRGQVPDLPVDDEIALFASELLPGWYEDWLLFEQERLRQLGLHGLEARCGQLTEDGAHARAIEVGALAVGLEPLRESAHRCLIRAHLAEGNVGEAVRQFHILTDLLDRELGIAPSAQTAALIAGDRA